MTTETRAQGPAGLVRTAGQWVAMAALAFTFPVTMPDANAQSGELGGKEVVDAVCASCHATGAKGAPKIGDHKAWDKRASRGLTSLTTNALKGIRQMPPHGGNPDLSDLEIKRAVAVSMSCWRRLKNACFSSPDGIGSRISTSTFPGSLRIERRGQNRPELSAIGTHGTPVAA